MTSEAGHGSAARATTTDMRVLRQNEWDTWYDALVRAFGGVPESVEERELYRALTPYDRCLGVWDGDTCVATAGAYDFRLTVPGGASTPAAGVTMVGVSATHRRRGILTSMMRRLLDDTRAEGRPLAVLTASEPDIYGRFGYAAATFGLHAEIDTSRVRLAVPDGTDEVLLRYADPGAELTVCEAVYARTVPGRAGMLARRPGWERLGLLDPESERGGASPLQCVLAERDGEVTGYARFRVRPEWRHTGQNGRVLLQDLTAVDAPSQAALWRFLFGIDLTTSLEVRGRPVDEGGGISCPTCGGANCGCATRCTCGSWRSARRWRRGRTRRRWTWCWTSRTRSAPGTRGVGGSPGTPRARSARGRPMRRSSRFPYGSWGRATSAG